LLEQKVVRANGEPVVVVELKEEQEEEAEQEEEQRHGQSSALGALLLSVETGEHDSVFDVDERRMRRVMDMRMLGGTRMSEANIYILLVVCGAVFGDDLSPRLYCTVSY
jgi:hypothetical protein